MELALNITFVGLTVVFLALIILSFVIAFFPKLLVSGKAKQQNITQNSSDEASVLEIDEDDEPASSSNIHSTEELIAVLTAAVRASMGIGSESNIIVKSFRRIPQNSPVWNTISRKEQLEAKL